jgi:CRISPR-associated endoribonuclease Cas6
MRILITLVAERPIRLPVAHNHIVQGLIYGQLEANLARWLHGEAYRYAKRTYRMFTFSRLSGAYTLQPKTRQIVFTPPVRLQLASHNAEVLASFAEHLLKAPELQLGNNRLSAQQVDILPAPELSCPARLVTLSPITIYSTVTKADGGKLTHYYSPHDKDWQPLVLKNLERKAKALGLRAPLEGASITPLRSNTRDKKVIYYRNYVIEAYTGLFEARLPEAYLKLAYDTGIGSKNAQGFGMVAAASGKASRDDASRA